MSSRTRRPAAVLLAGLMAASGAALAPAHAADFGFTTLATATPLQLAIHEKAIPIPTDPQFELDFSYTRVDGQSGPTGKARASALWPGPAVGDGYATFASQIGLPPELTGDRYPVQVNAEHPGETSQAAQEPFPGMTSRVSATDSRAVARVNYGGAADDAPAEAESPTVLDSLSSGDLSALGGALTGSSSGTVEDPAAPNPLGALSLLVDPHGMTSVSSTRYGGGEVIADATSRVGELRLLGGLVRLTGIESVVRTTADLEGVTTKRSVEVGGMTIGEQSFGFGPDGAITGGSAAPIPGLPSDPAEALAALGIRLELPKPEVTRDGLHGRVAATALRITIDTGPLRSKLPTLPMDELVGQLPEFPGQANLFKGLLLALGEATPRIVLHLGNATTDAAAAPPLDFGIPTTETPAETPATGGTPTTTPPAADTSVPPPTTTAAGAPPAATAQSPVTPVDPVSAIPGLPPLGSIPTLLTLLGLLLASGAGWYFRRAGMVLFGGPSACAHGLEAGVPDLRKA